MVVVSRLAGPPERAVLIQCEDLRCRGARRGRRFRPATLTAAAFSSRTCAVSYQGSARHGARARAPTRTRAAVTFSCARRLNEHVRSLAEGDKVEMRPSISPSALDPARQVVRARLQAEKADPEVQMVSSRWTTVAAAPMLAAMGLPMPTPPMVLLEEHAGGGTRRLPCSPGR